LVKMLEEGCSAFDEKIGFSQSDKKKIKKDKGWYLTIPLTHGTPNTTGEFVGPPMPVEIHKEMLKKPTDVPTTTGMRTEGLKLGEIPDEYQPPKSRALIEATGTNQRWEEYKHKASIYAGIIKTTSSVTGQSGYISFRRVSDKSDPDSWIHPGFEERNFMDKALDEFSAHEEEVVGNAINSELSKLGFET